MKKILCENYRLIIKNQKKLAEALNIKITNRGKEVFIEGSPEEEYFAEKVIDAVSMGFPVDTALLIKKEEMMFEILNLKDHTNRNDLERIRGRIIGKGGKTLKVLSDLTDCFFELKDNQIGIIGSPECIQNAQNACISLIKGSKQGNVYAHLEKTRPAPIYDLGLKENIKPKKDK
jgi:ribosomal RNA assembly protein